MPPLFNAVIRHKKLLDLVVGVVLLTSILSPYNKHYVFIFTIGICPYLDSLFHLVVVPNHLICVCGWRMKLVY